MCRPQPWYVCIYRYIINAPGSVIVYALHTQYCISRNTKWARSHACFVETDTILRTLLNSINRINHIHIILYRINGLLNPQSSCRASSIHRSHPLSEYTILNHRCWARKVANHFQYWIFLPPWFEMISLRWRHNGRDSVSNHQPHVCLLNRLFRCRSTKTPKLRVTGLCLVFRTSAVGRHIWNRVPDVFISTWLNVWNCNKYFKDHLKTSSKR